MQTLKITEPPGFTQVTAKDGDSAVTQGRSETGIFSNTH